MTRRKKVFNIILFLGLISAALFASFILADYIANNHSSRELIQDYGYFGILLVSFVAGLNMFVPIPAATFVPVFTAGGISLPEIIFFLIIGTMAANLLSYYLGQFGGKITKSHYPNLQKKLVTLYSSKRKWLPYFVFGFAAFIPLGIMGVRVTQFIIPLSIGTTVYQGLAAFGVDNLFRFFF